MKKILESTGRLLRSFWQERDGAVTVLSALCMIVLIAFIIGQIQVTSALARYTRLHQAEAGAILAVTKEGEDAASAARKALFDAFMAQNLDALDAKDDSVTSNLSATKDTNSVLSTYYAKFPYADIFSSAFSRPFKETTPVKAERYYSPIEAVLVLDGSSSMRGYYDVMQEIVDKVTDRLFRGEEGADDVRVSILAYQYHVNISRKYADKLFTPDSRKLYMGTTATELANYAKRKATLEEYHPDLPEDLLIEGSNTLGEAWDMACPARMPISSSGDVDDYVANLEVPPAMPEEGFTLLMGDERPIVEYTLATGTGKTQLANQSKNISATMLTSISTQWPKTRYDGRDIREINAIPSSIYDANLSGRTDRTFRTWKSSANKALSTDYSEIVSIPFECPSMPMLIGSNSRSEVLKRAEMWGPGWYTGGDEGFAWAIRALSPNWGKIWEVSDTYPAPYHSTTEKRILYFGGQLTRGYPDVYGSPNTVTAMCDAMRENGVDMYILLGNESLGASEAIYNQCNPKYLQRMSSSSGTTDLPDLLAGMATRQYRVRLAE